MVNWPPCPPGCCAGGCASGCPGLVPSSCRAGSAKIWRRNRRRANSLPSASRRGWPVAGPGADARVRHRRSRTSPTGPDRRPVTRRAPPRPMTLRTQTPSPGNLQKRSLHLSFIYSAMNTKLQITYTRVFVIIRNSWNNSLVTLALHSIDTTYIQLQNSQIWEFFKEYLHHPQQIFRPKFIEKRPINFHL